MAVEQALLSQEKRVGQGRARLAGRTVRAARAKTGVDVADGKQARQRLDLVLAQSVRVAGAVQPFVMAADRLGQPGRVEQQRGGDGDTLTTVRFDDAALRVFERPRMSEDLNGNAEHADV